MQCADQYITAQQGDMRQLNFQESIVYFHIAPKDVKVETDKTVTYAYFQGDRILYSQGDYDGRLLDGEYKEQYLNKALKEKGNYKNGVKDGEWKKWNDNGQLAEVVNWKEGKLDGKSIRYIKGQEGHVVEYKNNELVEKKEAKKKSNNEPKPKKEPTPKEEEKKTEDSETTTE